MCRFIDENLFNILLLHFAMRLFFIRSYFANLSIYLLKIQLFNWQLNYSWLFIINTVFVCHRNLSLQYKPIRKATTIISEATKKMSDLRLEKYLLFLLSKKNRTVINGNLPKESASSFRQQHESSMIDRCWEKPNMDRGWTVLAKIEKVLTVFIFLIHKK